MSSLSLFFKQLFCKHDWSNSIKFNCEEISTCPKCSKSKVIRTFHEWIMIHQARYIKTFGSLLGESIRVLVIISTYQCAKCRDIDIRKDEISL